jgi:uncharacterized protein (TIGR03435 family)
MMRILAQILSAFALCFCGLSGQTTAKPEFEVASIKPSADLGEAGRMMRMAMGGRGGPGSKDPTRYTAKGMTMMDLLTVAYHVKRYQISGPEWPESARFDINAKIPEGVAKEDFGPMLQNLLKERFGLVVHHETKPMPVYDLMVFAKTGSKLKEHVEAPPPPVKEGETPAPFKMPKLELGSDGFPALPLATFGSGRGNSMIMMRDRARLWARGETMPQFAEWASDQLSKPVTDSTGLTGKYDFILSWRNESMAGPMPPPGAGGPPPLDSTVDAEALPTLIGAVQEQLGLKLEPKKGNLDLVVIDHVEKVPTEN